MADNTAALTAYDFIPEYNFWLFNLLGQNPLNNDYVVHNPVNVDEATWRTPGSILDLLFSYNFDFDTFSIFFRVVSPANITDSSLRTRLYLYATQLTIYANDPEYTDLTPPTIPSSFGMSQEIIPDGEVPPDVGIPPLFSVANLIEYNIYDITYGEFDLLLLLYAHKLGQTIVLTNIDYNALPSALSKLIYAYLKIEINGDYTYYSGTTPVSDSDPRTMVKTYEKCVGDHYYRRMKVRRSFPKNDYEPELLNTDSTSSIHIVTDEDIQQKLIEFYIPSVPYDLEAFFISYDAKEQQPTTDYNYVLTAPNTSSIYSALIWNNLGLESKLEAGDILYMIWGYVINDEDLLT